MYSMNDSSKRFFIWNFETVNIYYVFHAFIVCIFIFRCCFAQCSAVLFKNEEYEWDYVNSIVFVFSIRFGDTNHDIEIFFSD